MNAPSIKERPILFAGPMVRALLDGSKTQTRRVIKPDPGPYWNPVVGLYNPVVIKNGGYEAPGPEIFGASDENQGHKCPYGQPGDRLWVRETAHCNYRGETPPEDRGTIGVDYKAGGPGMMQAYALADREKYPWFPNISHNSDNRMRWAPAINMPRWASRILLEIVSVRVERLNDIDEPDARAEGITDGGCVNCGDPEPCGCQNPSPDARDAFIHLWESINGAGAWNANLWVWVIEFKRVLP